jgi:6-phosphogluconolactonase (cycloisomerase 2 family)
METTPGMNTRFLWVVAVLCVAAGLVSCGSSYSASSDGLIIVPSLGSAVVQAFGFNLSTGSPSTIDTNPPIIGNPVAVVIDPAGAFAYVATSAGIGAFGIHSDGTLSLTGNAVTVTDMAGTTLSPVAISLDTAGSFLYVTTGVAGGVATFTVSSGTLTQTAYSVPAGAVGLQTPNLVALAVTPLSFPALNSTIGGLNSVCAGLQNPSAEYLYAVDALNNLVWQFTVDSSGNLGTPTGPQSFTTGSVPAGIAVDSCNRFVYVSNSQVPTINSYAICNASTNNVCPDPLTQNGQLIPVSTTSLNGAGSQLTALAVDPFANYLYVVDSQANKVFGYRLSQATGKLTALIPASLSTNSVPVSLAIRSDGMWMFVTNFGSATVSEYAIIPATGSITATQTITTDNQPFGVAVK